MIPITIDTRDLAEEFGLLGSQTDELKELAVSTLAQEFARKWEIQANQHLGATREVYKGAIQIAERGRFSKAVYLNPAVWLANAIEMGYSGFDMKEGFLKSKKVKFTKSGDPYLTIPFRFATPGSLGESTAFAGVLPKEIYAVAKDLPSKKPLTLDSIPSKFRIPKSQELRKRVSEIESLPKNKQTSIYEGLTRSGGGYMNFRRVSLKSHPDSWQHPGFSEANLAQKALQELDIEGTMRNVIDNFLSSV